MKNTISKHIEAIKKHEETARYSGFCALADDYRSFWRILSSVNRDPRIPQSVIDEIEDALEFP